jgi:hypothetical protein
MKLLSVILTLFFITSCSDPAEELLDFKNAFYFSSDVGHFKFIRVFPRVINGKKCGYPVGEYEAIKSFKGNIKSGEIVRLHGGRMNYAEDEKERILFIRKYTSEDTFSTDECDIKMMDEFKGISLTCCAVKTNPNTNIKEVAFFEMPDSERRGPDILISLDRVYKVLTKYGD